MGEGEEPPPVAGLAAAVRRRELRRAGRDPAGGRHARRGPRHHRPAEHGRRRDRRPAELPHRLGGLPAEADRRGQRGPGRGDGLHAARLALAVPHRPGRRAVRRRRRPRRAMAMDLFGEVLRDPQPADWAADPMESLAVLVDAASAAAGALVRGGPGAQGDASGHRDRRARAAAPLLQLAGVRRPAGVAAMDSRSRRSRVLPQPAQLQRQDLLARYPAYDTAFAAGAGDPRGAGQAAAGGRRSGGVPASSRRRWPSWRRSACSRRRSCARLPCAASRRRWSFRRCAPWPTCRNRCPTNTPCWPSSPPAGDLYGFLLNNERFTLWQVGSLPALVKQMQTMLREMGQYQQNHELTVKDLADAKWKQSAKQVLETLLKGSPADFSQPFDELVIVPDGVLWYLPFEALQVTVDGQSQPLISRFRIRYAPTLSLATLARAGPQSDRQHGRGGGQALSARRRRRGPHGLRAACRGRARRRGAAVAAAGAVVDLRHAVPAAGRAGRHRRLRARSRTAGRRRRSTAARRAASLADWLLLPWGGPDVVVLPGFHTAAEDALKRVAQAACRATTCFCRSAG